MPIFPNIQAVTFDVGGTLIQPWPSVGHIYAEVAATHGHQGIQPEVLNRHFSAAWQTKKHFNHSRPAWLDLVKRTFAGSLDEASTHRLFDDLYDRFAGPDVWRLFDDVHPTLEKLRSRHFKLGIISNWDERLRPLLARLQLTSYFDVIVISIEAGSPKPSQEIFDHAASSLGVPPASILHVGDSLAEDVTGAQCSGLQAMLLDRKGTIGAGPSVPNLTKLNDML